MAAYGMGMCVIAMFFGPYAPDALPSHVSVFFHNFKRFGRLTKLATGSMFILFPSCALAWFSIVVFGSLRLRSSRRPLGSRTVLWNTARDGSMAERDRIGVKIPAEGSPEVCARSQQICNLCYTWYAGFVHL
jgi:hypothetical protein